ncbi:hypothetical protein DOTSEDRAFT_71566 [Dothistroma septosporum NZE10]|uniref:Uncharacterized protein n=1 Tax=Dothistroma septosporum (strain NZE10 / CBS 128990) TaxID=675120 RepID=N1PJT3_DOTSN|nr:hypothetical protein DOTSEDRAFT_71566 [Dothistroma septosporum NZE10]
MYDLNNMIMTGAVAIICAHVASDRGWTSDWQILQSRKKRAPCKREVIRMGTESISCSSEVCDSAVAMSDSDSDIEVPDLEKSTSSNNSFACLDYFLDWDEEPDDVCIHLAATAFLDKDDPYLRNTDDDYWYENLVTNYIDTLEGIDRPLQQLEFRFDEKEETKKEALLHPVCCDIELAHQVKHDSASDWDPQDWDTDGLEICDSISQCPEKYRHEASYHIFPSQEFPDPIYRDCAGTGLLSSLEREKRLHAWIMASEHSGDWRYSRIESKLESSFQQHVMKTEHQWETRDDEEWEYDDEDVDVQEWWSWSPHPDLWDGRYWGLPWERVTPDWARRMGWAN